MRPLTLHASALSDAEYELYTSSLNDLAWAADGGDGDEGGKPHDDAYYEEMRIGLREARGWLRGRYAHLVPPGGIDTILRFFAPGLSQTDTLTGGQFFAALRLVVHAENGQPIDRTLAFVQAHPSTFQPGSPQRPLVKQLAPPTPASIPRAINTGGFNTAGSSTNTKGTFPAPGRSISPTKTNPFVPPQPQHMPHNPFAARPSSIDTPRGLGPPLPPRKPPPPPPPHNSHHTHNHGSSISHQHQQSILAPPPKHSSLLLHSGRSSVSPTRGHPPPLSEKSKPTPLPKPAHVTSTLMKQSLQASKAGHAMKRAEVELEQERVLRVLKSSASTGGHSAIKTTASERLDDGGSEVSSNEDLGVRGRKKAPAPPLPRRKNTLDQPLDQQQPSPPPSVSSLEHVALARAPQPPPPPPSVPHTTLSTRSSINPFPIEDKNPYHRSLPPTSDSPYHAATRGYTSPQRSPTHRYGDLPAAAPPSPTMTTHTSSTSASASTRPPTHPDRKPPPFAWQNPSPFAGGGTTTEQEGGGMDGGSPTGRVFRSKSLHHPSSPGLGTTYPPPPPQRRQRPESALVFGAAASGGSVFDDPPDTKGSELSRRTTVSSPSGRGMGAHRRQSSLSLASTTSSKSVPENLIGVTGESLSKIARTWQPRLEKARFKAEAGLSKRGYVPSPRSRSKGAEEKEDLLDYSHGHGRGAGPTGDGWEGTDNVFEPPSVDGLSLDGSVSGDEKGKGEDRQTIQGFGRERDELKWPVQEGEGWRRL